MIYLPILLCFVAILPIFVYLFKSMYNNVKDTNDKKSVTLVKKIPGVNKIDKQDSTLTDSFNYIIEASELSNKYIHSKMSFKIEVGEHIHIIGRSGTGKTTLLSILCGYNQQHSGQVSINGMSWRKKENELKQIVGYVPQHDSLFGELTPKSTLYFAQKLFAKGIPHDLKLVDDIISLVGLNDCSDTKIKLLSGGERKRVSIAIELLDTPKILILDEPDSGLDEQNRNILKNIINGLCKKGITVIESTHFIEDVDYTERVFVMQKNGPFFDGKMYDVKKKCIDFIEPKNPTVSAKHIDIGCCEVAIDLEISRPEVRQFTRWFLIAFISDIFTLSIRGLQIYLNNMRGLLYLFATPFLGTIILLFVAPKIPFENYSTAISFVFSISCAAMLIGLMSSIQDICKNQQAIRRDLRKGMSVIALVVAKLLQYGCLCLIMTIILVFPIILNCDIETLAPYATTNPFWIVYVTMLASSVFGLTISAFSRTPDGASNWIPFVMLFQMIFSGVLFNLDDKLLDLRAIALSSRSVEAIGRAFRFSDIEGAPQIFEYSLSQILNNVLGMLILLVGSLLIFLFLLKFLDIDERRV